MQIQKFLHSTLNVTDLAQSTYFYEQVLGFTPGVDRDLNFVGTWYQVGDFQLHLIVASRVPSIVIAEKWGRNRHVAFAIDDLASAKARLEQHNWPFQLSTSGRSALFVCDPDDNVLEFGLIT
jgi:glyoxylase I family protein